MTMARRKVTVFGGTGFLGQHVVRHLLERDFSVRVAARHPERIAALFPSLHLDAIQADVNDDRSVAAAVAGVEGVVNAASLYAESGSQTFHSVHVEAATRVARLARSGGRPVHPRVRHWRGCRIRLAVHPQPRERRKSCSRGFSHHDAHPPFHYVRARRRLAFRFGQDAGV